VFFKPEVDCSSNNVAELNLSAFGENTEFDVDIVGDCDLKEGLPSSRSIVIIF